MTTQNSSSRPSYVSPELKMDQVMGIPLLHQDPTEFKLRMAVDSYEYLGGLQNFVHSLDEQLSEHRLMRLTRDRLRKTREDYQNHTETMKNLLRPLGYQNVSATTYERIAGRKTAGHSLAEYYSYLCKDWGWGANEALRALEVIQSLIPADFKRPERVLVLGAGACRLPYEIHRWLKPDLTVCLDINPLLLSCASKLISGQHLKLYEFPAIPRDTKSFLVPWDLSAPVKIEHGIEFLVHDLNHWGLAPQSFDLIVTPWFIDVSPVTPDRLFPLINQALKENGHWLNFGPTHFNKVRLSQYFSVDETLALVNKTGFKVSSQKQEVVPHMQSPSESIQSQYHVLGFLAQKQNEVDVVDQEVTAAESLSRPKWLNNPDEPIQLPMDLNELQSSLAFSLDLAMKVQSAPSLNDLANNIAQEHQMSKEQATYLISNTLRSWLGQSMYNPQRRSER